MGWDGVTEVGVVAAGGRGLSLGLGEVLVLDPFTLFRHLVWSLCCLYLSRSLRLSAQYVTHQNIIKMSRYQKICLHLRLWLVLVLVLSSTSGTRLV